MRTRMKVAVASATMITATVLSSAGSASAALHIEIQIQPPNGDTVVLPSGATPGGLNAIDGFAEHTDAPPIESVIVLG